MEGLELSRRLAKQTYWLERTEATEPVECQKGLSGRVLLKHAF